MLLAGKKWILLKIRKPRMLVTIILCLIGVIMILTGTNNTVLSGIGISLLASGITSALTFFFLYETDDFRSARDWGLTHVYRTRGEMNASCDAYMNYAKSIKAIGFGFSSLRNSQNDVIIQMLQKGGNIKIITMKPGCQTLKVREADENQDISQSISDLIVWAKQLNESHYRGKIEIRMHDHLPPNFMFMMDDRLFTGPYEYGKISQQSISFEYGIANDAYIYYEELFDRLWNDETFCKDALAL